MCRWDRVRAQPQPVCLAWLVAVTDDAGTPKGSVLRYVFPCSPTLRLQAEALIQVSGKGITAANTTQKSQESLENTNPSVKKMTGAVTSCLH